jgi:hypothetical protein
MVDWKVREMNRFEVRRTRRKRREVEEFTIDATIFIREMGLKPHPFRTAFIS